MTGDTSESFKTSNRPVLLHMIDERILLRELTEKEKKSILWVNI